ncbi:MAG: oligopeptide/dipeptide ABC transporter ATP-binding protein [Caldilineaceae bacterium]
MADPLLQVVDLVKSFPVRRGFFGRQKHRLLAVDRANLTLLPNDTFGLVGESGCGKSTLGLTIMQLYEPNEGKVVLEGRDLAQLQGAELQQARRSMQMIFQDPYASVDPRMTVGEIVREPLDIQKVGPPAQRSERAAELLEKCGVNPAFMSRFPNEFSGGQQQRIGIARALMLQPKVLICDEPVSSLDVSVQAQILNLLRDLQDEFNLSYIFISHNIAVTAFMSHRIGVMYLGKIVEVAASKDILNRPKHPYTRALLSAVPDKDPRNRRQRIQLTGELPSPIDRPSGCPFHPRCPLAADVCRGEMPPLRTMNNNHQVACYFAEED